MQKSSIGFSLAVSAAVLMALTLIAQTGAMTDQRVVDLCKRGVSPDEMVALIMAAPEVSFELSPASSDALMRAGVPDRVLKAMAARMGGTRTITLGGNSPGTLTIGTPGQPSTAPPLTPYPDEIGVYFRQGMQWSDIPPEIINWQTGGVVKHVATVGIVKGDVNARIPKSASPTKLKTPIDLLVYCTEDSAITEYQLIRLHEHSDSREFRTVTGGVFHVSGGAKRDTIDFENVKLAKRTYLIRLPAMPSGQYGILPPGAHMASSASEQLGKMYTFAVE